MKTVRRLLLLGIALALVLAAGAVRTEWPGWEELPGLVAGDREQPGEDWRLLLVNGSHPLPEGYTVALKDLRNGQQVDQRIYPDLQAMFDAARAEGLAPLIISSYRSREKQESLFEERIREAMDQGMTREEAEANTARWVALPDRSEHQTGLALDISAEDGAVWAVYNWMAEHCWEYGFILRYPEDKAALTGIENEPWHFRYVGKEAALELRQSGQCLEEYLNAVG